MMLLHVIQIFLKRITRAATYEFFWAWRLKSAVTHDFPVRPHFCRLEQPIDAVNPKGGDVLCYPVGGRESLLMLIGCLLICPSAARAEQTLWLYGSSDNAATYGVTADASYAITWKDNWASEQSPPTARAGSASLQVNRPTSLGTNESVVCYGWSGLNSISGLTAARIKSVKLYYKQDYGHSVAWQLYGLPVSDAAFDAASTTWDDIDGAGALDWSNGTMGATAAAGMNLGSFTSDGELGTDTLKNIDITRAFKLILQGCLGGVAMGNFSNGTTFTASDQRLVIYSNENATVTNRPGLLVTLYDEPKVPTFTSYSKGATGFTLNWNSEGAAVQVQRSTDLQNWVTIVDCVMENTYKDPNPPAGKAFYRLLVP